jgi:hypothetical protein
VSDDSTAVAPVRDEQGRLLPGHPGLPGSGRPRGTSQSDLVRKLIEPHRQALIERALKLTESADPFAAANGLRICLERLAPAPKQEAERIEVPGLAEAGTFAGKCDAVIRAVSNGDISAEAGERVLRLLDVYRKAHETDALEARIVALEAARAPLTINAPAADGGDLV